MTKNAIDEHIILHLWKRSVVGSGFYASELLCAIFDGVDWSLIQDSSWGLDSGYAGRPQAAIGGQSPGSYNQEARGYRIASKPDGN